MEPSMTFTENILDRVCRYYVFLFLLVYGLGKLMGGQFYRRGELPADVAALTLGEVEAFPLAWTFMGYSGAYIAFVGISQIIGALLLLHERTKLLGVTILIPILVNIIVFDIIFLNDGNAALGNAILYLLMLCAILYFNRRKVITAFNALTAPGGFEAGPQVQSEVKRAGWPRWKIALVILGIMGLTFGLNMLLSNLLGYGNG
jgi:hypothetical protein